MIQKKIIYFIVLAVIAFNAMCKNENDNLQNDEIFKKSKQSENGIVDFIEQYVSQDLPQSALFTVGEIAMKLANGNLNISIDDIWNNEIIQKEISLSDKEKKSLLMALIRANFTYQNEDLFDFSNKNDIYTFAIGSTQMQSPIWAVNTNLKSFVYVTDMIATPFIKNDEIIAWPRSTYSFGGGAHFSTELSNVLSMALNMTPKSAVDGGVDDESFKGRFVDNIINESFEQLLLQFEEIQKLWKGTAYAKCVLLEDGKIPLNEERFKALLISIARLRVVVGKNEYRSVLFENNPIKIPEYGLKLELPSKKNIYISIQDKEGIIYVKNIDRVPLIIADGAYYSPELYNIILSIFSDIARENL